MDGGARRGRFRRQARGHRGAQQQAPRAGVAPGGGGGGARGGNGGRGGARGGNGGRGGARGWNGGRGGGRVGNGGGDGARAGNAVGGQLHGQRRGWLPDPRLRDWFANSQFVNPSGLTVEDFEYGLDAFLTKQPRIDLKELNVYFVPRDHRQQGEDAVRLLADVNFSLHKFALTRKILLRFYVDGDYTSSGADYWRRRMEKQKKVLQDQLDALDRDLRMPSIFSTSLCLLPKEK